MPGTWGSVMLNADIMAVLHTMQSIFGGAGSGWQQDTSVWSFSWCWATNRGFCPRGGTSALQCKCRMRLLSFPSTSLWTAYVVMVFLKQRTSVSA